MQTVPTLMRSPGAQQNLTKCEILTVLAFLEKESEDMDPGEERQTLWRECARLKALLARKTRAMELQALAFELELMKTRYARLQTAVVPW